MQQQGGGWTPVPDMQQQGGGGSDPLPDMQHHP